MMSYSGSWETGAICCKNIYASSTVLHRFRSSYTLTLKILDFPNSAWRSQMRRVEENYTSTGTSTSSRTLTRIIFDYNRNWKVNRPSITIVYKMYILCRACGSDPWDPHVPPGHSLGHPRLDSGTPHARSAHARSERPPRPPREDPSLPSNQRRRLHRLG